MVLGIITGIVILVLLVVVHELGHAIAAKRSGVTVEEFGIGFPPRAWARKLKSGMLLTLNWLPVGGFVRLKGEYDAAKGKGSYGSASFWQKTKILFAGVLVNWLVAAALLTILAWTGLPKILSNQFVVPNDVRITTSAVTIGAVAPGSAAERAAFRAGDRILAVDGQPMATGAQFVDYTRQRAGKEVTVQYQRNGETLQQQLTLGTDTSKGLFGASLGQSETIHATWSAPVVGVATAAQLSWETLTGLGGLIGKLGSGIVGQFSASEAARQQAGKDVEEVANSVAGPVGIIGVIFPSAQQQGVTQVVLLTAVISLTLAVMNALPIPAFDGGRWWTMAIFRLLRKKLTREREERIQAIGFFVLFGLIIVITIADIGKLW